MPDSSTAAHRASAPGPRPRYPRVMSETPTVRPPRCGCAPWAALVLLAACGPSPPPPVPLPPVEITPAGQPPAPASSEPPPALALTPACAGTHLDLQWMIDRQGCRAPDDRRLEPPPGALATAIEPGTLSLAPGASTSAWLILFNTTNHALELDLNLACSIARMRVSIRDSAGRRADVIETCGHGSGCGGPSARITLDPHGDARIRVPVRATFRVEDNRCELGPEQPMKPGRYTLEVDMPFGPPAATATLEIGP